MNLNDLLTRDVYTGKKISTKKLTDIIKNDLQKISDLYESNQLNHLSTLRNEYLYLFPYLLYLGKKEQLRPWFIDSSISPSHFDQCPCSRIESLTKDLTVIVRTNRKQLVYKRIIHTYIELGLYLGMTPKHIQRLYEENLNYKERFKRELWGRNYR